MSGCRAPARLRYCRFPHGLTAPPVLLGPPSAGGTHGLVAELYIFGHLKCCISESRLFFLFFREDLPHFVYFKTISELVRVVQLRLLSHGEAPHLI